MSKKLRFTLLFPLAALLACGSPATPSAPASNFPSFSGDWGTHTTTNATAPINGFVGVLSASGGTVSGSLIPFPYPPSPCTPATTMPIPVSGTLSSTGNLTLTLPVAGGIATLTATLTSNLETLVSGTYQIVGGACAMASSSMVIAQYAPLGGTYTGTVAVLNSFGGLPNSSTATTITAVLTESTTPNANDMFPVTGTVTATGACTASVTLSNTFVWGGSLFTFGPPGLYTLAGGFDPTGTVAQVGVFTSETPTPGCPYNANQIFDGALTRQ